MAIGNRKYRYGDENYDSPICPVCGEEITIDEDIRKEGSIKCPGCGELLEFEDTEE